MAGIEAPEVKPSFVLGNSKPKKVKLDVPLDQAGDVRYSDMVHIVSSKYVITQNLVQGVATIFQVGSSEQKLDIP